MRPYLMFHSMRPPKFYSRPFNLVAGAHSWLYLQFGFLYYSEQHSISVVSTTENSVSLYASSPNLTMGSECRRNVPAGNSLLKEFDAPLVQQGPLVFVHHCAPANWERAPRSRSRCACAEAHSVEVKIFAVDQFWTEIFRGF